MPPETPTLQPTPNLLLAKQWNTLLIMVLLDMANRAMLDRTMATVLTITTPSRDLLTEAPRSQATASILSRILDTNSSTQGEHTVVMDTKVGIRMANTINMANRMGKNMDRITTRILSSNTMVDILVKATVMIMEVDIVLNSLAMALLSNTIAVQVVLVVLEVQIYIPHPP